MIGNNIFTTGKMLKIALVALLLSGCSKFEEYNTNPNQVTEQMMDGDNLREGSLFAQMQKNVFPVAQTPEFGDEKYQVVQNLIGDIYSGYMGVTMSWATGGDNSTYNLLSKWYGQPFELGYTKVMSAWNAIRKNTETANPAVFAIAQIIKVESMHRVTDMYGPIPYINFGSPTAKNGYDAQKDVYYRFFQELEAAVNVLTKFAASNPGAKLVENYDFVYYGDVASWIRFANTLRLRLAVRIVYADPAKAKLEAEAAVNQSYGVLKTAVHIARLNQGSNLPFNHPLYIISSNFNDIRMGASIDSYMNGYQDPRLASYFKKGTGVTPYIGIRIGINISNKSAYADGPFSSLNFSANSPILWMSPAEAYFLRAEGALRGWNMGDTPQNLYEAGVKTSFEQNGASGADAYLANSTNIPKGYVDPVFTNSANARGTIPVKWDAASTFEISLERIITQKWIAVYPDGQEAWSEFRRTGYPKIFPVVVNNSNGGLINTDKQIRRIPFPPSEYINNSDAVTAAISLLGGADHGGTNLWWDKK